MQKKYASTRKPSFKKSKFSKKKNSFNNKKKKYKIPIEVKKIAQENDLGIYDALAVHKKKMTLEEAIQKKKEKVERKKIAQKICNEYPKIQMALACHLVKEDLSVEEFFARKKEIKKRKEAKERQKKVKMEQDISQKLAFEKLSEYVEKKTNLIIEKYKGKEKTIQLQDFTPYDFFAKHPYKDVFEKVHRLEIKYMYPKSIQKTLKKFIMLDKSLQKKRLKPSHGKEGRFSFTDDDLSVGNEVMLALHEGEILRGKIVWATPYDIILNLANNKVWVFRHAVNDCMVMKRS